MAMTDTPTKPSVLLIRESAWQSIVSDTYSAIAAIGVMGIGWWLNSSAMQWCGFLLFWITLAANTKDDKRRSPQDAADYLKSEYGVTAK